MGRKKRLYAKKPPLSGIDKAIYRAMIVIGIAMFFIFAFFGLYTEKRCFADSTVVAVRTLGIYCFFPLSIVLFATMTMTGSTGLEKKQPIVGNKNFRPKPSEPMLKVYPLFSREFRENLSAKAKRKMKIAAVAVGVCVLISAIIFPFGLYPRQVLDKDNNVRNYDSFNRVTHADNIENADKMSIAFTKSSGHRRGTNYGINVSFDFGDEQYIFNLGSFGDKNMKETLEYMLYLKSFFDEGEYELCHVDHLDGFVTFKNPTAAEKALVYELFEYNGR